MVTLAPPTNSSSPRRSALASTTSTPKASPARSSPFPGSSLPAAPSADIAVLAANINWNAYNNFGGRSNYIHPDCFPPTPTINARLELKRYTDPEHINYDAEDYAPLSFDRPEPINHVPEDAQITDPIAGRSASHVAPAEWRFLGWLEREGYAYDLYAETQLHFGQLDLDQYKVLIITTHPEYWSRKMYYDVKAWVRERGGKLMYLGGNGLNCEVELLDEQTMKVKNGDMRVQRAEGYESRFHQYHESEANLLGVVCTLAGIMTAAPYQVLAADHWIFANTGVKNGDAFGAASLHERVPGGASGHETDKTSPFSPPGTEIIARGLNPDRGGAEIVHYETAQRRRSFFRRLHHLSSLDSRGRDRLAHYRQRHRALCRSVAKAPVWPYSKCLNHPTCRGDRPVAPTVQESR